MELKAKRLFPEAKLPERAHHDDAGLDLFANEALVLEPGEWRVVGTGIALAIPSGYAGHIWDKSSLPAKWGIKSMGGVVDAQYRGEIKVTLINLSQKPFVIEKGSKIAQLVIQRIELPEICEAEELDDTLRGEGGFGSTGHF